MDGNRKLYLKGALQIVVFMLIIWVLLSGSPNFSIRNFLLGTIIFALGVGSNIYFEVKKS